MSIATKVLVMDLYAVQYAIPARKPKTQNKPQKQTSKPNKQNKQQKTSNKTKNSKPRKNKTTKRQHTPQSSDVTGSSLWVKRID